ncbi:MAG: hypothetical protein ACI4VF_01520, partial [Lachnospirales bacterium]
MSTNSLKNLYEKIPKGIKYAFSPVFIRLMVKNKEFTKTFNELDKFEKMTEAEKKVYQFSRLKETLVYAYKFVPYYKRLFDKYGFNPEKMKDFSDIEVLPILEKNEAVNLGEQLYSTEPKLKYYKTFTGGSSGKALTVMLDKASIYRERACVCHYLSKLGYNLLKSKTVAFWGHNKDSDYYYSPLKNEI